MRAQNDLEYLFSRKGFATATFLTALAFACRTGSTDQQTKQVPLADRPVRQPAGSPNPLLSVLSASALGSRVGEHTFPKKAAVSKPFSAIVFAPVTAFTVHRPTSVARNFSGNIKSNIVSTITSIAVKKMAHIILPSSLRPSITRSAISSASPQAAPSQKHRPGSQEPPFLSRNTVSYGPGTLSVMLM